MLSKIMIICAFAMGHFLYYDLTGALMFALIAVCLEWMIGKQEKVMEFSDILSLIFIVPMFICLVMIAGLNFYDIAKRLKNWIKNG